MELDRHDNVARLIGAAVFRPQPHMSGDIWQRLGPLRRRACEDAATSVMEYLAAPPKEAEKEVRDDTLRHHMTQDS